MLRSVTECPGGDCREKIIRLTNWIEERYCIPFVVDFMIVSPRRVINKVHLMYVLAFPIGR